MKLKILLGCFILGLVVLIVYWKYQPGETAPHHQSFWIREFKIIAIQLGLDSAIYSDSLPGDVFVMYFTEGDECQPRQSLLILRTTGTRQQIIFRETIKNCASQPWSIVSSNVDTLVNDSLYGCAKSGFFPKCLKMVPVLSGCIGCKGYFVYCKTGNVRNAFSWQTQDLRVVDFNYKRFESLFNDIGNYIRKRRGKTNGT